MIAGVQESWDKLNKQRAELVERFKKEYGHTPQGEVMPHHFEESKNKILAELDATHRGGHLDPDQDKHQDTIDRIVGNSRKRGKVAKGMTREQAGMADETPKKKRGRPKGSKNKPKPQPISPEQVGSIPNDLGIVILRRG